MMTNNQIVNRNKRETSTNNIENADKTNNSKSSNVMSLPIQIILSIILGIAFGLFMNKGNVYISPIIRDQMLFKRLSMFKMFLAAVGMSMLSVFIITLIKPSTYQKILKGFIQHKSRINAIQLIIGGNLIGVGMVLAGSCPGTIFIQIGSGLRNSLVTGLGASCGVLFYYLFLHNRLTKSELSKSSIVLQQLPDLIGLKRIYLNLILGLSFLSIAFLLEYIFPYKNDLKINKFQNLDGWSPALCGIGVGFLQFFFMIFFEKSLGVSSGFTVLVAQLCRIKTFKKLIPSLESFTYGIQNNLILLFTFGAILGSFISTYSSNQFPLDEKYGANLWTSFVGGFFLLIGARCAGGCTSGQGISGVTHLLIGSFIATVSMFAGGIIFALSYGLITNDWQFSAL